MQDHGFKVLIVDERHENLLVLKAVLKQLDVEIFTSSSAEDALGLAEEHAFAVLISEVHLPGLNGFELVTGLRSIAQNQNISVVFVTEINVEEQYVFKGYKAGAIDYVLKPVDPEILKSKVNVLLEMERRKHALETEIEERIQIEKSLKKLTYRYDSLLHSIGEGVIELDIEGNITFANPMAANQLFWDRESLVGKNFFKVTALDNGPKKLNEILQHCKEGQVYRERDAFLRKKDGHFLPIEFACTPIINEYAEITGIALIILDVTERKLNEERLTYMAEHDVLTGLGNRMLFYKLLPEMVNRANRNNLNVVLLFLDLDRFKTINDSLGHDVGDKLLRGIAERLVSALRKGDTVVRLGGDEFTIILEGHYDANQVATTCQKITRIISEPFYIDGHEINTTTSIGIATYPDTAQDAEGLTKCADAAMYCAKETGRNNFQFYTQELNEQISRRMKIENRLHKAIEQNEFSIYYQPRYDLKTGKVTGAEALLRWHNDELGMVPPDVFIPIAEDNGLIHKVGSWVLETCTKHLKQWEQASLELIPIAINVSLHQLNNGNLGREISKRLKTEAVLPHHLEIELTESAIMSNPEEMIDMLEEIHKMGVSIAIDDFGTGYSSLSYLKLLPIDTLKIDKTFISDIATDQDNAIIVRSVISLAHNLGLKAIAEGIECKEQLETLQLFTCEEGQGYYFCVPMSYTEFTDTLSEQNQNTLERQINISKRKAG